MTEEAGLDVDEWQEARDKGLVVEIAEIDTEAQERGFDGTPSVAVRGPGGEEILGTPQSADEVLDAVDAVAKD